MLLLVEPAVVPEPAVVSRRWGGALVCGGGLAVVPGGGPGTFGLVPGTVSVEEADAACVCVCVHACVALGGIASSKAQYLARSAFSMASPCF